MKDIKTRLPASFLTLTLCTLLTLGPRNLLAASWREPAASASGAPADARDQAARKLELAGLAPAQARERVSAMTDAEARHAAQEAPAVRRGGDATTIILLLVIVGLVSYILYDQAQFHGQQY